MAPQPTGLGRGLDALIRQTQDGRDANGVQALSLDDIVPNPRQPRREFNEKTLAELAASIKSQGLLQPLLVRPLGSAGSGKYEIVAGERRWRASQLAGLQRVPVLIRDFSARDTLAAALIENLQREDLNPLEEALGLQALKEEFGLSQDDMARKLGKSRSAIANSLRLLSLPEETRALLAEGSISPGHGRALLGVADAEAREELTRRILEQNLSVREAEGLAAGWKESGVLAGSGSLSGRTAGKGGTGRQKKPQSAKILDIQNLLAGLFDVPVRVTGKEDKGRITLSYNSEEELRALLGRLSGAALEGASRPALSGGRQARLEGSASKPLAGGNREMLTGESAARLDGSDAMPLEGSAMASLAPSARSGLDGRNSPALAGANLAQLRGREQEALPDEPPHIPDAAAPAAPAAPDADGAGKEQ